MQPARPFRVGLPRPFAQLLRPWGRARSTEDAGTRLPGQWLEVSGGPLPVPIAIRVDRADDGRFMVTGLLIGLGSRTELTWETLRRITPSTVLAHIFAGFDPKNPVRAVRANLEQHTTSVDGADFDVDTWAADQEEIPATSPHTLLEEARAMAAYELWKSTRTGPPPTERPVQPVTRPRASVATDLAEFAQVYLKNLAATPHRATQATADELHVSRATAIRRLADARHHGLIPFKTAAKHQDDQEEQ